MTTWADVFRLLDELPEGVRAEFATCIRLEVESWTPELRRDCDCDYPGPGCPTVWAVPWGVLYTDCVGLFSIATRKPVHRGYPRLQVEAGESWASVGIGHDDPRGAGLALLREVEELVTAERVNEIRGRRPPEAQAVADRVAGFAKELFGWRCDDGQAQALGDAALGDVPMELLRQQQHLS